MKIDKHRGIGEGTAVCGLARSGPACTRRLFCNPGPSWPPPVLHVGGQDAIPSLGHDGGVQVQPRPLRRGAALLEVQPLLQRLLQVDAVLPAGCGGGGRGQRVTSGKSWAL